jgi:hypothetical protein
MRAQQGISAGGEWEACSTGWHNKALPPGEGVMDNNRFIWQLILVRTEVATKKSFYQARRYIKSTTSAGSGKIGVRQKYNRKESCALTCGKPQSRRFSSMLKSPRANFKGPHCCRPFVFTWV